MSKIVLTEKQLKKILDRIVEDKQFISEAPAAPGTPANPGGMTDDEILKRAAEIRRVRSTNASLITPGTTANDYFKNPDGTIKVTDLPGVTVTAKRGPAPAINAPKNTLPSTAINNVNAVAAAPNVSATPTATVGSGPTTPTAAPATSTPAATVPTSTSAPTAAVAPQQVPATAPVQAPAAKQMSGQEMHNLLMQKGLINGFTDVNGYENRRIVYKGAPLSQEQLGTLTKYLVDNGYGGRYSQVGDKRYGQKYVWVKGGNALPSDLAA